MKEELQIRDLGDGTVEIEGQRFSYEFFREWIEPTERWFKVTKEDDGTITVTYQKEF